MDWATAVIVIAALAVIILIPVIVGIWSRRWMMNIASAEFIILFLVCIFLRNPIEGIIWTVGAVFIGVDKVFAYFKKAKEAGM